MFLACCLAVVTLFHMLEANPSGGAKGDLDRFHLPSIETYRHETLIDALRMQDSAMGPLFYTLASALDLSATDLRVVNPLLLLSAVGLAIIALMHVFPEDSRTRRHVPFLFAFAIFILNPWTLGPALWGNPDTLALFFAMAALVALVKGAAWPSILAAGTLMALAVLTRQSAIALLAPLLAVMWTHPQGFPRPSRTLPEAILLCTPSLLALAFLVWAWGGLTPPGFAGHAVPSLVPVSLVIAYFGLLLAPVVLARLYAERTWATPVAGLIAGSLFLMAALATGSLPAKGGSAAGKLLEIGMLGPWLWGTLYALGAIGLAMLARVAPLQGSLLMLFFLSFLAMGDIFYQKYLEPYVAIAALASAVILTPKHVFGLRAYAAYLLLLYGGFLVLALHVYQG
ncbi:MAG: hypothetical protein ACQETK_12300 [Pseudomonadota bacterium]